MCAQIVIGFYTFRQIFNGVPMNFRIAELKNLVGNFTNNAEVPIDKELTSSSTTIII